jgi:hypothetical protein
MAILHPLFRTRWAHTLAALLVISSQSAPADTIQIFNQANGPIVLSDLIVWSSPNRTGIKTVLLKPNDPSDDITLTTLTSATFGGPFTFIGSYAVSETATINGKLVEERSAVTGVKVISQLVIAFLTDDAGNPLFLRIDDSVYTPPPSEGTLLMFTNGVASADLDWTLYTSFDESSGVFSGLYSGEARVASTALAAGVDPVPEPASWLLVCSGVVLSVEIYRRLPHMRDVSP